LQVISLDTCENGTMDKIILNLEANNKLSPKNMEE
jgi:hypothetical protein